MANNGTRRELATVKRDDQGVRVLRISAIRRDGKTQHRLRTSSNTVREYAALMAQSVVFPPVRVWFDESEYWLADGFQRLAAAELAGLSEVTAEVFHGTLEDAQWDSYAANSVHGMRRSKAEAMLALKGALQHPRGLALSNVQIGKHLNLPESTVRRWRAKLGSVEDGNGLRVVTRGKTTYTVRIGNIGRGSKVVRKTRSLKELKVGLEEMKVQAGPSARRLLNIFGNWAFGPATEVDCLAAIERILH